MRDFAHAPLTYSKILIDLSGQKLGFDSPTHDALRTAVANRVQVISMAEAPLVP